MRLADGSVAPCRTQVGTKGVPEALLVKKPGQDNIDLFPMSWLIERWCSVTWGEVVELTTPKGRKFTLKSWHELPFLTKEQLTEVIGDLPHQSVKGRSGRSAGTKVAATGVMLGPRACTARVPVDPVDTDAEDCRQLQRQLRQSLQHLRADMEKTEWEKLVRRYSGIPDQYYGARDDVQPLGPSQLGREDVMDSLGHRCGSPAMMWELMAGSGRLSDTARRSGLAVLPPVDFRWGFHLGRFSDQLRVLYTMIVYGCHFLYASPSCFPWGQRARSWSAEVRDKARRSERLALQFLTVLFFLQVVMGRAYGYEQPKGSDMPVESDLSALDQHLTTYTAHFDQCMKGAAIDGQLIRKSSELHSNVDIAACVPGLTQKCDKKHTHLHVRGSVTTGTNKGASKSSASAMYPPEMCDDIVELARKVSNTASGGSPCIRNPEYHQQNFEANPTVVGGLTRGAARTGECTGIVELLGGNCYSMGASASRDRDQGLAANISGDSS